MNVAIPSELVVTVDVPRNVRLWNPPELTSDELFEKN